MQPDFWEALDQLVANSEVVIDRPSQSAHPNYADMLHPLDYGYLAGTTAADGGGIDVWMGASGEKRVVGIVCIVDLIKREGEIKVLLGCTEDEIRLIVRFFEEMKIGHLLALRI